MVRKICLDSDVLIALLNEDMPTKELLESLDASFCISAVNSFEIWYDRKDSEGVAELLQWLEIIPLDDVSARLAADMLRDLKKHGRLTEFRDLFIAASCIVHHMEILTYNKKDFAQLKKYGLKLVE